MNPNHSWRDDYPPPPEDWDDNPNSPFSAIALAVLVGTVAWTGFVVLVIYLLSFILK